MRPCALRHNRNLTSRHSSVQQSDMCTCESVRVNIFRGHEDIAKKCGKVMLVGSTLENTLQEASAKFGEEVVSLVTVRGAVVEDVSLLRDWDVIMAVVKGSSEPSSLVSSPHDPQWAGSLPDGGFDSIPSASVSSTPDPVDFALRRTSTLPSADHAASRHDWVRLNVGGRVFATTRATLASDPNSMLARMFEPGWSSATDSSGAYLIDRSPEYFEPLLNFLRHGKLILNDGLNHQGVLEEAKFFGISKAIDPLEAMVQTEELAMSGHFTRKEFLRVLSITSSSDTLRCQGTNMEGVDLSNLDLRNINFKCANLRFCKLSNCDLTNCVFERADMYKANLDGAIVQCVHMPRVNLEGASLRECCMSEKIGIRTNLEGANLKGAILDNSQMNGVNFRLASLKGASLRSCNLRYSVMAGTDLENCDLTGCDLQHANLRGSNLAGAIFDNMVAPLHMSQTVNVTVTTSTSNTQGQAQPLPVDADNA